MKSDSKTDPGKVRMEFDDIDPVFREAIGTFEAFRKMGFPAEEIFVLRNKDGSMLVMLRTQGKEFGVAVGSLDMTKEQWMEAWKDVALAVGDGRIQEDVLDQIWLSCRPYAEKVSFVLAIGQKGILIPPFSGTTVPSNG